MKKKSEAPVIKELFSIMDENAPKEYIAAYKMLCTNIEFIAAAQKCKNIMITSTMANEGKTNCSVNLALSMASQGKKVCLVECDLRRPSIHRFIDSKRNTVGLTHVLKGEVELSKALRKVSDTSMSILLAGISPPNATELLASDGMKMVVAALEKEFDYVIYDTPPAYITSDAAVLGKSMDVTFLVIKHNSTEKKTASRVKRNLENAGVKIFGVILTFYKDKTKKTYSDYYSYDYYYSSSGEEHNG